jgi:hypothetical protein
MKKSELATAMEQAGKEPKRGVGPIKVLEFLLTHHILELRLGDKDM